jgi:CRISPR-associated protein Csb3
MSEFTSPIQVRVDVTNPAHYFSCCGLLEIASRLNAEAQGWFESEFFKISNSLSLAVLVKAITESEFIMLDREDITASPILIPSPINLRLDWWKAGDRASSDLKVWAGKMESFRIAKAMQATMRRPEFSTENMLNVSMVAYEEGDPTKKVEPFYFDARRGPNAHSRDVGFAPNDLGMTTIASPAAELLCLIGLQRVRPVPAGKDRPRQFDYWVWTRPTPALLAPVAAAGLLPDPHAQTYRFESWYRTGQRKHKAFLSAKLQPNNP